MIQKRLPWFKREVQNLRPQVRFAATANRLIQWTGHRPLQSFRMAIYRNQVSKYVMLIIQPSSPISNIKMNHTWQQIDVEQEPERNFDPPYIHLSLSWKK